jgi:homoserine kinase
VTLEVRVPATAANLGPGFDALGLAFDLWNQVLVEAADHPTSVEVTGEGAGELPEEHTNLVVRSMGHVADRTGGSLPDVAVRCINRIPLERGLGSSASAVVAGVLAADRLLGAGLEVEEVLDLAVEIEGHPDNVAACLYGGLVVAYRGPAGWRAERLDPHPDVRPVVLIPESERVSTESARRALPTDVPLADAAFNAGRAALAVIALTRRPELLPIALEDRLHQDRRLELAPAGRAAFDDLRAAGIPVCVAGAGPSLVAFESPDPRVPDLGPRWRVLRLQVARKGADVLQERD